VGEHDAVALARERPMRVIAVGVDHTDEAFQKRDGVAAAWGAEPRVNQAFTITVFDGSTNTRRPLQPDEIVSQMNPLRVWKLVVADCPKTAWTAMCDGRLSVRLSRLTWFQQMSPTRHRPAERASGSSSAWQGRSH